MGALAYLIAMWVSDVFNATFLKTTMCSVVPRTKKDIWMHAIGATVVVCAAPVFILPFIPLGNVPHQNDKCVQTVWIICPFLLSMPLRTAIVFACCIAAFC